MLKPSPNPTDKQLKAITIVSELKPEWQAQKIVPETTRSRQIVRVIRLL